MLINPSWFIIKIETFFRIIILLIFIAQDKLLMETHDAIIKGN